MVNAISTWFGVGDPWQRPNPPIARNDLWVAFVICGFAYTSLVLMRVGGLMRPNNGSWWTDLIVVLSLGIVLIARRRLPHAVAAAGMTHMFIAGNLAPVVMGNFAMQIGYFVTVMSLVAYGQDRKTMLLTLSTVIVFVTGWLTWLIAVNRSFDSLIDKDQGGSYAAAGGFFALINVIYFAGAVWLGNTQWHNARRVALLQDYAETIATQSETMKEQAVLADRVRIARELHDVVAHHIAVVGIHAGAAKRISQQPNIDQDALTSSLTTITTESHSAVEQMRNLVGTLRTTTDDTELSVAEGPGLADIQDLVEQSLEGHRVVSYDHVIATSVDMAAVPHRVGHATYRAVQEALANVQKHSTATTVRVTLRINPADVEVEIVDNGRPKPAANSSGLGQLGMRERASALHGSVEYGPRITGGYRVRFTVPYTPEDDPTKVGTQ